MDECETATCPDRRTCVDGPLNYTCPFVEQWLGENCTCTREFSQNAVLFNYAKFHVLTIQEIVKWTYYVTKIPLILT